MSRERLGVLGVTGREPPPLDCSSPSAATPPPLSRTLRRWASWWGRSSQRESERRFWGTATGEQANPARLATSTPRTRTDGLNSMPVVVLAVVSRPLGGAGLRLLARAASVGWSPASPVRFSVSVVATVFRCSSNEH